MVPSIDSGLLLPLLIKKKEEKKIGVAGGVGKRKTVRSRESEQDEEEIHVTRRVKTEH